MCERPNWRFSFLLDTPKCVAFHFFKLGYIFFQQISGKWPTVAQLQNTPVLTWNQALCINSGHAASALVGTVRWVLSKNKGHWVDIFADIYLLILVKYFCFQKKGNVFPVVKLHWLQLISCCKLLNFRFLCVHNFLFSKLQFCGIWFPPNQYVVVYIYITCLSDVATCSKKATDSHVLDPVLTGDAERDSLL